MRAFGADLSIVPSEGGLITPDLFTRMIAQARKFADADDTYFTNQLENADVVTGHEAIGRELLAQFDRPIHAFCGGVGTAGVLMGVARFLRNADSPTRIVALEPAGSPALTTGAGGTHHVDGIGLGSIPPLLEKELYDEARAINETDARQMARRMARKKVYSPGLRSRAHRRDRGGGLGIEVPGRRSS